MTPHPFASGFEDECAVCGKSSAEHAPTNKPEETFELNDDQLFEALINLIADHGCASNDADMDLARSLTNDILSAHQQSERKAVERAREETRLQLEEVKNWFAELISPTNTSSLGGGTYLPEQFRRQIETRITWIDAKLDRLAAITPRKEEKSDKTTATS